MGHQHPDGVGCTEVLAFRRWGVHGRLEIAFRPGGGRWAYGYPGSSGAIGITGGAMLNLNEPGTARAFLDEALALGWQPEPQPVVTCMDGWTMFDAVVPARIMD